MNNLATEPFATPIRSFIPGAFGPEAIAAMGEAFDAACKELRDAGQPHAVREVIAGRIIAAATFGERDPVRCGKPRLLGREATETRRH